jgi:hypothetical protein
MLEVPEKNYTAHVVGTYYQCVIGLIKELGKGCHIN